MRSPAQTQHGLEMWPRSGYSLCALGRRWWRGRNDLFSQWHPDKDGDWDILGYPPDSQHLSYFMYLFELFFGLLPSRVSWKQRCLQKRFASPWLWSCMSTLWGQISATMTGTWTNEWHPVTCFYYQLLINIPSIRELDTIGVIHASSTPNEPPASNWWPSWSVYQYCSVR